MKPRIRHRVDKALGAHEKYVITRKQGMLDAIIVLEDTQVFANKISKMSIEKIQVPEDRLIVLCSYYRHPLGNVISVGEKDKPGEHRVEDTRELNIAMFLAWDDGVVKKGETIGVVDTFPIRIK